jgi:Fe-S cluster assembly protein SufD
MLSKAKSRSAGKNIVQNIPEGLSHFIYHVGLHENFTVVFIAKNIQKAETHICVNLDGIGATAKITGIVIAGGQSRVVLHTMQIHKAPHTTSDSVVKTVVSDHASIICDSDIRIEKSAQKSDAYLRNENLLLSPHAYAESKPSLEILADDVRCTHGAATGPINEEQLWYLTSRGISRSEAERLIVDGFIQSALDRV